MKAMITLLAVLFSTSAFAAVQPTGLLSTEVMKCAHGNEVLSVQVLSNANGDRNVAVGTFVDYKRGNTSVYSTTSYGIPKFVPAGAGGYNIEGYGTEAGKVLSMYQDYMTQIVRIEGPSKRGFTTLLAFDNCKNTGAMGQFTNVGNPILDPVPAKKAPIKSKPFPFKKI